MSSTKGTDLTDANVNWVEQVRRQAASDGELAPSVHLVKLCVGTNSVEALAAWQAMRSSERVAQGVDGRPRHVTRMWPRRSDELLRGGSLFWIVRGLICVRQRIEALEPVTGPDGVSRCAIVLSPELIRLVPRRRSAFQGWRYLSAGDAPPDLAPTAEDEPALPPGLQEALARFGVGGA